MTPEEISAVVVALIETERRRQGRMWGGLSHDNMHDNAEWLDILHRQEVHVAEAVHGPRDLPRELTQMIAVGIAWLGADLQRRIGNDGSVDAERGRES